MNLLSQMIAADRIPHALLLTGKKGAKLVEAVRQFAVDLIGKYPHPDVREYFPEGKTGMHPIQTLRKLAEEVGFVPYQAKWKIFIVHEADRMLPTSSNALLKTFEEPTARTVIALLSHHPEKMLPTILSRCRKIEFTDSTKQVRHKILDVLAGKEPLESLEESEPLDELFESIHLWFRDRMLLNMEGGEHYLSYPEYQEQVRQTPCIPLEQVEAALKQARLGCERSIKLVTSLEALFFKLRLTPTPS
jgi:DNA polymerase III delta prime subunit